MSKIFHVELKNRPKEEKHYYFGSKTAIFDTFTKNDIGISKQQLWITDLTKFPYLYENNYCIIHLGVIQRIKTNRGKK